VSSRPTRELRATGQRDRAELRLMTSRNGGKVATRERLEEGDRRHVMVVGGQEGVARSLVCLSPVYYEQLLRHVMVLCPDLAL
jgi:hypothetical protein